MTDLNKYRSTELEARTEATSILSWCMEEFRKNGWSVRVRGKYSPTPKMAKYGTTLPYLLLLPYDWQSRTTCQKAALVAHERIHMCQYLDVGVKKFRRQYLFRPSKRLAWEIQAYAESIRTWKRLGAHIDTKFVQGVAEGLRDDYGPWLTMRPSVVYKTVIEALTPVLDASP